MLNGKTIITLLTVGLLKNSINGKFILKQNSIGREKVELDLPNYATKADFLKSKSFLKSSFSSFKMQSR